MQRGGATAYHKVVHLSVTILDLANKNYQVLASVYN